MNKEKIKNFWEEHETEIELAKSFAPVAAAAFKVWALFVIMNNMKAFDKHWRKASKGAQVYLPACGDELVSLIEPFKGVIDANGKKIDVTGALLFGNVVDA